MKKTPTDSLLKLGIITLSLLSLQSCAFTLLDLATPESGYGLKSNISYGPLPRQQLDVYTPTSPNTNNITVLFFYGGAWQDGNKNEYRFVAQALAEKGYQVVIPDYRIYPEVLFPEFMYDAARALAWTSDNIDQRIVVMGHSAGAHIATLLLLDQQYMNELNIDSSRIAGLIGLSGPYDFLPLKSRRLRTIFNGADDIAHTQPINYVSASAPTTLLIHGLEDSTVLPFNSKNLAKALTNHGVSVTLRLYPSAAHAVTIGALSVPFRNQEPVLRDIDQFLSTL